MADFENIPELEADWVTAPTRGVYIDQVLATGHGLDEDIAPESFVVPDDGGDYVRFGRITGYPGGPESILPILPSRAARIEEAQAECPDEQIFIVDLDVAPEEAWYQFFANSMRAIVDGLEEELKPERGYGFTRWAYDLVLVVDPEAFPEEVMGSDTALNVDVVEVMGLPLGSELRRNMSDDLARIGDSIHQQAFENMGLLTMDEGESWPPINFSDQDRDGVNQIIGALRSALPQRV